MEEIKKIESFLWLIFEISLAVLVVRLLAEKALDVVKPAEPDKGLVNRPVSMLVPGRNEKIAVAVADEEDDAMAPEPSPFIESPTAVEPIRLADVYARKELIGEILLERQIITRETLDKALAYQAQYGVSITQYLLQLNHIDHQQLAQCLSAQFKVPYLPIGSYNISRETIELVPVDVAHKYWVVPVEQNGDLLTVVMLDPVDAKAIKELEKVTGLRIVPFVGIISEILQALRSYYHLYVNDQEAKIPSFLVDAKTYVGIERRNSIRYRCELDIQFPMGERYIASKTIDVSREGLLFASPVAIEKGTVLTLQINLPPSVHPLPIAAVVEVVRCQKQNDRFEVGVRTINVLKKEIGAIMSYAVVSQAGQ